MLRMTPQKNAGAAKSYFDEALSQGDYYLEDGQEIAGRWGGKAGTELGLQGQIGKDDFYALCDNINPQTGEQLTARNSANRRVAYDMTFSVPKSVSAAYVLNNDGKILSAFQESVQETMEAIEKEMQARVRVGGKNEDRLTQNMVWGEFVHFTSRPVNGIPDPHLHAHAVAFNVTFDSVEDKWKAGEFADIKRNAPYHQAAFDARMAQKLSNMGYPIQRQTKGWEIAKIAPPVIEKFSQRTQEIEKLAKKRGIESDKDKDGLGALSRSKKAKGLSMNDLCKTWMSRLTPAELESVLTAKSGVNDQPTSPTAKQSLDYAIEHSFTNKSVMDSKRLLAVALEHGVGAVSVEAIATEAKKRKELISSIKNGREYVTTKAVLAEEKKMVRFVVDGKGKLAPLKRENHTFKADFLNHEQKTAVNHVFKSHDRVIAISGGAGTGKTTLMQEAVKAIEEQGKQVFTFAPSAAASRGVLRKEGFETADTVARLLKSDQVQEQINGGVIWIDEAGLLSSKDMQGVFQVAKEQNARVILSGDTAQHAAVSRGDALRILQNHADLQPVGIRTIQRQKVESYKNAVYDLSAGKVQEGFEKLDKMAAILEVENKDLYKKIAGDYVANLKTGKSGLVVSPTHAEGQRVTEEIRQKLKKEKAKFGKPRLAKAEKPVASFRSVHLTDAQKKDGVNYRAGQIIQFYQNAKGIKRGERFTVQQANPEKIIVANAAGKTITLPTQNPDRFKVFEHGEIKLAAGDSIRITDNGQTIDKKHSLDNGALHKVDRLTKNGNIKLANGWEISKDFGHVAYGYCTTSHSSQGKTVDKVFIVQSAESFPASSSEQFYVSVSRGKHGVIIYTNDKEELLKAIKGSGERMAALDLESGKPTIKEKIKKRLAHLERIAKVEPDLIPKGKTRKPVNIIKEIKPPPPPKKQAATMGYAI